MWEKLVRVTARCAGIAVLAMAPAVVVGGKVSAQGSAVRWIVPYSGQDLAVDPATQRLFVFQNGTITTLNARTGAREQQVMVQGSGSIGGSVIDEQAAHGILLYPGLAGQVVLLDTQTGLTLHSTTVTAAPPFLAADVRTGRVYVPGSDPQGTLTTIDAMTGQIASTMTVGGPTYQLAVDEQSGRVFAITVTPPGAGALGPGPVQGPGTVRIVDPAARQVIASIPVGRNPAALAVDPQTGNLFVANALDNTVSVIDGRNARLLATVATNPAPTAVVVDAAHARAYVLCQGSWQQTGDGIALNGAGTVDVLDTQTGTVLLRIPVGAYANSIALDPRTGYLFVGSTHYSPVGSRFQTPATFTGNLRVVSTGVRPLIRTLPWPRGSAPLAMAVDQQDGRLYVLSAGSTTLSTGTVAGFTAMLDESRL